jgi:hypothetical protein
LQVRAAAFANIILAGKKLAGDKHSCLIYRSISDEEKKVL